MGRVVLHNTEILTEENAQTGFRVQGNVCFYPPEAIIHPDEYDWVDRQWDFKLIGSEALTFAQSKDLAYLLDLYMGEEEGGGGLLCQEDDEASSQATTTLTFTLLTEEQKKTLPIFAGSSSGRKKFSFFKER